MQRKENNYINSNFSINKNANWKCINIECIMLIWAVYLNIQLVPTDLAYGQIHNEVSQPNTQYVFNLHYDTLLFLYFYFLISKISDIRFFLLEFFSSHHVGRHLIYIRSCDKKMKSVCWLNLKTEKKIQNWNMTPNPHSNEPVNKNRDKFS